MTPYSTAQSWTGMPGEIVPADGNYAPASVAPVYPDNERASLPEDFDGAGATQKRRQDPATKSDDFDDVLEQAANGGTTSPIDLGPNNERLEDVNPKVVHALRELVRQYREEGIVARRNEIRRIRQARLFWQGLQYAWWNPNDMNWHLPYENRSSDDRQLEDMPRYQFVTNFYQGFGLSFVAVLKGGSALQRFARAAKWLLIGAAAGNPGRPRHEVAAASSWFSRGVFRAAGRDLVQQPRGRDQPEKGSTTSPLPNPVTAPGPESQAQRPHST